MEALKNLPWKVNLISFCRQLTIYVLSNTNLGNKCCFTILVDGPMVSAGLYLIMPLNCKPNLNRRKNCKRYLSLTRRQHCKKKSFNFSKLRCNRNKMLQIFSMHRSPMTMFQYDDLAECSLSISFAGRR
jgi:hypothetical protein